MSKKKRIRLLTNRNFTDNNSAFEFIEMEEIAGEQYLYQRIGETEFKETEGKYKQIETEGCFPVSMDFVQERFIELGREYTPTGKEKYKKVEDLYNN